MQFLRAIQQRPARSQQEPGYEDHEPVTEVRPIVYQVGKPGEPRSQQDLDNGQGNDRQIQKPTSRKSPRPMRKSPQPGSTLEVRENRPAQQAKEVEIDDEPIVMPAQVTARVNTLGEELWVKLGE